LRYHGMVKGSQGRYLLAVAVEELEVKCGPAGAPGGVSSLVEEAPLLVQELQLGALPAED